MAAVLLLCVAAVSSQAQEVKREITKIAGDLYRFQNKFHYSVFLVTPEGVIVTDPIDADAAAWLRPRSPRASTSRSSISSTATTIGTTSPAARSSPTRRR